MTAITINWFAHLLPAELPSRELPTEGELVRRAGDGDTEAFAELVRRHQANVFNVAYRMTGNHRDAEDVTQETFLRAFRTFESFDAERPLAPWLKRITVNQCLNRWQSARSRKTMAVADVARPGEEMVSLDRWTGNTVTPEQSVLASERAEAVQAAILQLPPHYRAAVELRHFQGLPYVEIAETLDRSLANVKSDLFRARQMLAQLLEGKI